MSEITRALATRNDAADRNMDAATDYARKLAASELLPKAYVGKPANVLLAAEYGRSIGLDPVTAIQMTHIVQGKPTASAQLVGALVRRAGHKLRVKGDALTATCKIVRADDPEFTFEVTWTMDRAKKAGLLKNPVWGNFPEAMLKARAITECARDACPEVLAGIAAYTAEEVGGSVEIIEAQTAQPEIAALPDGTVIEGTVLDVETGELFDAEIVEES